MFKVLSAEIHRAHGSTPICAYFPVEKSFFATPLKKNVIHSGKTRYDMKECNSEQNKVQMGMYQCIHAGDTSGCYEKLPEIAVRYRWNIDSPNFYDDWQFRYANEAGDIQMTFRFITDHEKRLYVGATDLLMALGTLSVQKAVDRWIRNDIHYFQTGKDLLSLVDAQNIEESKRPMAGILYPGSRKKAFIACKKALEVISNWKDGKSPTAERRRKLTDDEWSRKISNAIDWELWLKYRAIRTIQFSDFLCLTKDE